MLQKIATWLVARPLHGVMGLATTLIVPFPLSLPLSGAVAAHLVLAKGLVNTAIKGIAAVFVLMLLALVLQASAVQIVASALIVWLPVMLLAGLVRHWRSVTLAMQVSVIAAMAGVLAFFVVHGDPAIFWNEVVTDSMERFREIGASEYAVWLEASREMMVPQMSMVFVFISWTMVTIAFFIGYGIFQSLPERSAVFGRFCDLNLGRVLAIVLAAASVIAVLAGSNWLLNIALLIFFAFYIQGLSIVHWLRTEKSLPIYVLIVTYVLLILRPLLVLTVLAILGYLDAWFDIRARLVAKKA